MKILILFLFTALSTLGYSQNPSIDTLYIERENFVYLEDAGIQWTDFGLKVSPERIVLVEKGNEGMKNADTLRQVDSLHFLYAEAYFKCFDKAGRIIEEGYWLSELLNGGTYKSYHVNGNLRSTGAYRKGKKKGAWVYYDNTGKKINPRN